MRVYSREFDARQLAKLTYLFTVTASPLLVRSLWRGPRAGFDFSSRTLEVYRELVKHGPITDTTLSDLGMSDGTGQQVWLDLSHPSSEMPPGELALICALVKWKNPTIAVEIGTFKGVTTLHLSRNTSENCRIYTVDLPPQFAQMDAGMFSDPQLVETSIRSKRAFGNDPKIVQILHDSTTMNWNRVLDGPVDFALIDASHLYQHVKADTEAIMKVLARDGIVVWHDYRPVEIRRGVKKYLDELRRNGLLIKRLADTSICICQYGLSHRCSLGESSAAGTARCE